MTSGPLDAALGDVLERSGAQVARVLDARTGAVLGEVGAAAGDDLAALARLATQAGVAAAAGGGLDDLVLATRRAVHVLRAAGVPGSILHLRLDAGRGDLAAARRALASARLRGVVRAVRPGPGGPVDLPVIPAPATGGQPALAALYPSSRPRAGLSEPHRSPGSPTAELAVRALGPVAALPRRIPSQLAAPSALRPVDDVEPGPTPPLLRQAWATDPDTLRRLLIALRRPPR